MVLYSQERCPIFKGMSVQKLQCGLDMQANFK